LAKKTRSNKTEIAAEKKLGRGKKANRDFEKGHAFVEEPTGSATMVNLDGRWDFDHPVKSDP
jgi:hypothetical protein